MTFPDDAPASDALFARAQRVNVSGTYDFDHEIALINRSRDGAPGVNILTPLRLPGRDTAVIVNRGWVYSPDGATIDLTKWREPPGAVGTAYVSWLHVAPGIAAAAAAARVRDSATVPAASSAPNSRRQLMTAASWPARSG